MSKMQDLAISLTSEGSSSYLKECANWAKRLVCPSPGTKFEGLPAQTVMANHLRKDKEIQPLHLILSGFSSIVGFVFLQVFGSDSLFDG